jgi:transposase
MSQITVYSGPARRRRWSAEERFQILGEAFAPGACVADVARRHDISTGLLYTWRSRLRRDLPGAGFAEAVVTQTAEASLASGAIVIDLVGGGRVSIAASAPPALAAAALKALR